MVGTPNGPCGANAWRPVVVGYRRDLESVHAHLPRLVVSTVVILDLPSSHANATMTRAQVSEKALSNDFTLSDPIAYFSCLSCSVGYL